MLHALDPPAVTHSVLDTALAFHQAGCSVVRAAANGTKAPLGGWKEYQQHAADPQLLATWFTGGHPGLGVVTGHVSGNLELLEFEGRAVEAGLLREFKDLAEASGLTDLIHRIFNGYCEATPSGGLHFLYRATGPVPGNTKLARDAEGKLPLIETRGEGGFVIVAPSNGRTHPTGKPWTLLAGGPATIPTLTTEEHRALHILARCLDRAPQHTPELPPGFDPPAATSSPGGHLSPGDDYNQRATWDQILGPHGWQRAFTRGNTAHWTRPGKTIGTSATTGYGGDRGDYLYVFTSSTELPVEQPLSKFGAYTHLEHRGDFKAAAAALKAAGYGTQTPAERPPGPVTVTERLADPFGDNTAVTPGATEAAPTLHDRLISGGSFILDAPDTIPAVWGRGDEVLMAEGEALLIVGGPGVGKTTIAQQFVRARLGFTDEFLGWPVQPTGSRVLYLAMDRPSQIARAFRRLFTGTDREALDQRLTVWKGPPPYDLAARTDTLRRMADIAGADTVVVDSLKDAALGLTEDEVGAGYNRARQLALTEGVQVLELHHQVKRGANGGKPDTLADVYGSAWITAGAGSVLHVGGLAGDPIVELRHLKQPAAEIGPVRVIHHHSTGQSTIWHSADLLAMARMSRMGVTAKGAACAVFGTDKPTPSEIEKARRKLDGLVRDGQLRRREGVPGGVDGSSPATWHDASAAVLEVPS
jgi:replicative DNA helicase